MREAWPCSGGGDPEQLGPASVNLTFAPSFRVFRKVHAVIDVGKDTGYRQLTDKIIVPDGGHILITPGETVLDITRERLRLGPLAVHSAPPSPQIRRGQRLIALISNPRSRILHLDVSQSQATFIILAPITAFLKAAQEISRAVHKRDAGVAADGCG